MKNALSKESYLHHYAKYILMCWLKDVFLSVRMEYPFYLFGRIYFKPDIVCFTEDGINTIIEIVHKHDLTDDKIKKLRIYQIENDFDFRVLRFDSNYILSQTKKPNKLKCELIDIWKYKVEQIII